MARFALIDGCYQQSRVQQRTQTGCLSTRQFNLYNKSDGNTSEIQRLRLPKLHSLVLLVSCPPPFSTHCKKVWSPTSKFLALVTIHQISSHMCDCHTIATCSSRPIQQWRLQVHRGVYLCGILPR